MWNILLATSMVFFLSSPAIGTIDSRSPRWGRPKGIAVVVFLRHDEEAGRKETQGGIESARYWLTI
jgi:hypothetical protein